MAIKPLPRRFTVTEYHQMADAGILNEDDHLELINGEIVEMTAIGGRHIHCVNRLNLLLVRYFGDDAIVSIQNPVQLSKYNEPEPDVVILRPREFGNEVPTVDDVLLLIEVADTSIGYDRAYKLPLYASVGIPEVWIVDLQGEKIGRHTDPGDRGYRESLRVERGSTIESRAIPGMRLEVNAVLG